MATAITLKQLSYRYSEDQPFALKAVTSKIPLGSFTMVVGPTGSGKSTLLRMLNGLLIPTRGEVTINPQLIKGKNIKQVVGLVFQNAADQLFASNVKSDLAFGPHNFKYSSQQIQKVIHMLQLKFHFSTHFLSQSPTILSGGFQKQVALAGVVACQPKILLLDEPTVGLDTAHIHFLMKLLEDLRQKRVTIVMATHRMDLAAEYGTNIIALNAGKLVSEQEPRRFFTNYHLLHELGLEQPYATHFAEKLVHLGWKFPYLPITLTELAGLINKQRKAGESRE